jgi:hypothetical protein
MPFEPASGWATHRHLDEQDTAAGPGAVVLIRLNVGVAVRLFFLAAAVFLRGLDRAHIQDGMGRIAQRVYWAGWKVFKNLDLL